VPAVVAGFVIVHGGGLTDTAIYYVGAVILLAAFALLGLLRVRTPRSVPHEPATR
jgi:hypothetical protein